MDHGGWNVRRTHHDSRTIEALRTAVYAFRWSFGVHISASFLGDAIILTSGPRENGSSAGSVFSELSQSVHCFQSLQKLTPTRNT